MLKATLHQVQPAKHTRRKYSTYNLSDFKNLQHLPTPENSIAFLCARLTCVLSALPTSPRSNRPRNRLHLPRPCALWETALCFAFFVLWLLLLRKTDFQWICDSSLSFRSQKGDRPEKKIEYFARRDGRSWVRKNYDGNLALTDQSQEVVFLLHKECVSSAPRLDQTQKNAHNIFGAFYLQEWLCCREEELLGCKRAPCHDG